MFASGDGNFHLQLRTGKGNLRTHPSLFGDAGVWANQELFEAYIAATKAAPDDDREKAALSFISFFNL